MHGMVSMVFRFSLCWIESTDNSVTVIIIFAEEIGSLDVLVGCICVVSGAASRPLDAALAFAMAMMARIGPCFPPQLLKLSQINCVINLLL
jgi:hypothetical protein